MSKTISTHTAQAEAPQGGVEGTGLTPAEFDAYRKQREDYAAQAVRQEPERDTDCEDQGFSRIAEGCINWPCYRTPLVKWSLGWRCPKCGGCY